MAKSKGSDVDFLGLVAFVSAVGNLVQADHQDKLHALYRNLAGRYEHVCKEYTALINLNHQLQKEIINLRVRNAELQKQLTATK